MKLCITSETNYQMWATIPQCSANICVMSVTSLYLVTIINLNFLHVGTPCISGTSHAVTLSNLSAYGKLSCVLPVIDSGCTPTQNNNKNYGASSIVSFTYTTAILDVNIGSFVNKVFDSVNIATVGCHM